MSNNFLTMLFIISLMINPISSEELPGLAIMGQQDKISSRLQSEYAHKGLKPINDGLIETVTDTWRPNDNGNKLSYVGLTFTYPLTQNIRKVTINLATYFDGGWFGTGNPGEGEALELHNLDTPKLQITKDGKRWFTIPAKTNYKKVMKGHIVGDRNGTNPTISDEISFILTKPYKGVMGIRLIGKEGGRARNDQNGFIGVSEFKAYTSR